MSHCDNFMISELLDKKLLYDSCNEQSDGSPTDDWFLYKILCTIFYSALSKVI